MEAPIAASSIPVSSSSDDMNTSADTVTDTPFTGYGNGHPPVTQNEKPSEKRAKPANLPIYLNPSRFTSHFFFGPYIFIPLITTFAWLSGILALMAIWVRDGKPRYAPKEADIVFISNVAGKHKNVFIPMTCVTAGGFVLSLLAERWLRHYNRLPTAVRRRETIFHWLAIFFAALGGSGLIALSIMDNFAHGRVHWSMTVVFVVGTALSAIFQSGEVWSLHKDHPDRKSLFRNSVYKLIVVVIAVACAIAFGSLYAVCRGSREAHGKHSAEQCNRITSRAAAMEWTVAFVLVFYFLTLVADLWPAGKSSPRYMAALAKWQERHEPQDLQHDFTGRRAFSNEGALERWHTAEAEDRAEAERQARQV